MAVIVALLQSHQGQPNMPLIVSGGGVYQLPYLPYPLPAPVPAPIPAPIPAPEPSPEPTPGVPTPGGSTVVPVLFDPGQFAQPFADLFHFDADWKVALALLLLAGTVEFVQRQNETVAWTYVGILLLGIIVWSDSQTSAFSNGLKRLTGG